MRFRHIAVILAIFFAICLFVEADSGALKYNFFKAGSFFDGDGINLFDTLKKGEMTEFFVESKDGENNISYSVYTDGTKKYYLESPDNFDFTVISDQKCAELLLPYDLIDYFTDSARWYTEYSKLIEGFAKILENHANESNFTSYSAHVKIDGIRRKCDTITMSLPDGAKIVEEIKRIFSSAEFADMLNDVYGVRYSHEQIAEYIEQFLSEDKLSVIYKRSIVSGKAIEETVTVSTVDNIYSIKATDDLSDYEVAKSINISDMKKTLNLDLSFQADKSNQKLKVNFNDCCFDISEADGELCINVTDEAEKVVKIRAAQGYSPMQEVYDMNIIADKRMMFTKISGWLTGNKNAALLFKTYEVDLEPLNFNAQD